MVFMQKVFTAVCFSLIVLFGGLIAAEKIKPHVYPSQCVGCGDCVQVCPKQNKGAIMIVNGKAIIDPAVCIACNFCVNVCSFEAVKK